MSDRDPTFRNFSNDQAKTYATTRGSSYPQKIYETIIQYHKERGGTTDLAVDVGCGPGNSTLGLGYHFDQVVGLDAGSEMINVARKTTAAHAPGLNSKISYTLCSAEEISESSGLEKSSVDVVCVSAAVHWFDLEKFYKSAAHVLKPGGTMALWTGSPPCCHPSTPNAAKIDAIFSEMREALKLWMLPGNIIAQDMYRTLSLPWEFTGENFAESSFTRFDWNGSECPLRNQDITLEELETLLSTGSPVIRWRDAHPDIAGTSGDLVHITVEKIRCATNGQSFNLSPGVCLLLFQRSGG